MISLQARFRVSAVRSVHVLGQRSFTSQLRAIEGSKDLLLHGKYPGSAREGSISSVHQFLCRSHPSKNAPETVISKVGRRLHLRDGHPLYIIKKRIEAYLLQESQRGKWGVDLDVHDDLNPVVDPKSCFDDLRVAKDHVSRRPSDTYYLSDEYLLRTHTSAHQNHFISSMPKDGGGAFVVSGDVYRRDEIDSSHYPVFHQMEGVRIWNNKDVADDEIARDLKLVLGGLAEHLFGKDIEMRWNEDYFPFTEPSFELEVKFEDKWLEVLGCGVVHKEVMEMAHQDGKKGWAFGLGLERLAMVLFGIPDIRLFWSEDERFHEQFRDVDPADFSKKLPRFNPYSRYPGCWKDVSFWLPSQDLHQNDVYEVIRGIGGDLVERVELFDEFTHKKPGKTSHAYRITYRHMDRSLTNEEVDSVQFQVRDALSSKLGVELR